MVDQLKDILARHPKIDLLLIHLGECICEIIDEDAVTFC